MNFLNKFRFSVSVVSIVLFFLNFFLKVIYLDSNDIALDEPFTLFYSPQSIPEIFEVLKDGNNPPLHFLLLHYWIGWFGLDPFAVRFPSLLFSCFTAVVIFLLGNRFFSKGTGIIASLLFTFSAINIFFSHEARVYSLLTLLSVFSFYCYLALVENSRSKRYFFLLLLTNVLLLYAHYIGGIIILCETGFIFILGREYDKRKILKRLFANNLLLLICYLPNLFVFYKLMINYAVTGTWVKPPDLESLYDNIRKFSNAPVVAMLFLALLVSGTALVLRSQNETIPYKPALVRLVMAWFFIPYISLYLISFLLPVFLDRYLIFLSIPFYLSIAIAIEWLFKKTAFRIIAGIIVIIAMAITMNINPSNGRDAKMAAELVKSKKTVDTFVLISPPWAVHGFLYYFNIGYFKSFKETSALLKKENIYPIYGAADIKLNPYSLPPSVILFQSGSEITDPENTAVNFLSGFYKNRELTDSCRGYRITVFSK